MKKAFVVLMLILAICSSLLAGTLASYTVTLDDMASGSVVGKEFIFLEDGTDTFQNDIKIAPTETITWQFAVKNFEGSLVTETDLYYDLTFDVMPTPGKSAIEPLIIRIKDMGGTVIDTVEGTGSVDVSGAFPLSATGQSASFTVEIFWPSNDEIDINYAGNNFGTTINVSAAASQLPLGGGDPPDPPEPSDIEVLFQTGTPWQQGGTDRYAFSITITNNTDEVITNWALEFLLAAEIYQVWNAVDDSAGLPGGQHRFLHPATWNQDIPAGGSVQFGGNAIGSDTNLMTTVTVNGQAAEVTHERDCIL